MKQIAALDRAGGEGKLKRIGRSQSDDWNQVLAAQAMRSRRVRELAEEVG